MQQNPFVTLGINGNATAEQIRAAYHERVKQCHPDSVRDEAAQQAAQDSLIKLNLAYAEAMRQASNQRPNVTLVKDAKLMAKQLMEQGRVDSALRMLNRAPDRDAEWFDLQGTLLLKKGEAEAAHACFRTAVRMDPDNVHHRELALKAGVEMRKQKTLRGKVSGWARNVREKML